MRHILRSDARPGRRLCAALAVSVVLAASCASGDDTSAPDGSASSTTPPTDGVTFVGSDVGRDDPSSVPSDDIEAVVAGDTDLGLDLLRLGAPDHQNVILSPYSVATALAMLLPGARGETRAEIGAVLSADDEVTYHPARGALDRQVTETGRIAEGEGDPFTLRAANKLFGQAGFPFAQDYLDLLARYYGTDLATVDFSRDPEAATDLVNRWVEEQTEDRIVDLVPQGVIDALTRLVLVNAVYFNAGWRVPFDPQSTTSAPFHDLDGDVGPVDMMRVSLSTAYADGDGYEAVRLGYAGDTTSMLVIVPDDGTFVDFAADLDATGLADIRASLDTHDVDLALPSFEERTALGLTPLLEELGMRRAFSPPGPDGADLTGITDEQVLFVQDALHQAFISVDEEGTEAAAATAIIIGLTAAPEVVALTADRPFLFVIEHDATGEPLFLGQITELAGSDSSSPPTTAGTDQPSTLTDADRDEITQAFTSFFGGLASTVDDKVALLEDGETYREMLEDASANEQFQQMTTEIRDITAGSRSGCETLGATPPCAVVTHDLLIGGFPMAVAITSPAVPFDDGWLVGARAWCNIVEIGGESCP